MKIRRRPAGPSAEAALAHLHPVLQRVYARRGVTDAHQLDCSLAGLASTDGLAGLESALDHLAEAVMQQQRILLVGDFDADGASSCALGVLGLRALGARHVEYLVPNRFEYGYGLTPEIVDEAFGRRPDLLVTVDNGVSSVEGVRRARELGMRVVVTDHHLPPAELPVPDAMVNPNLPDDTFPGKHLAGVGVLFYVLAGLRGRLREWGWFSGSAEPQLAGLLDLVALGTVADVVPLDQINRVLVEQGLRRIRAGHCRPGITALLEVGGREPVHCVSADLGFAAGPRLNAAGRLDDMTRGIECLLCDDPGVAREHAQRLDALNRERREIEGRMAAEAMAAVEAFEQSWSGDSTPAALCVTDSGWHQGVVGIVASRLKERFHRPVIAFAPSQDGELKGSARSVPGLHVRDALEEVAVRHPALIQRFGGHAAAAGLSVRSDRFEAFRQAFSEVVDTILPLEQRQGVWLTDGELAPAELSLEVARALRGGGPWGQGFPEPVFDGVFLVAGARVVGDNHLKLRLQADADGRGPTLDAIAFRALEAGWDEHLPARLRVVYRLDVNRWRGRETVQMLVEHMQSA
ncbi:single-stranded-DNA-specific exonuclease RecJ [Aquisalimonas sp. 2447]|uniref:single-stranded-DNA-specific exonuclease RecJ n=1 Tax=Aquisalimonas sp. 2447 TaxID=2740807 RepID=UPI0014324D52|nr:single-stranded-DNA-specific exonuclease RecJ [Aquisalimonas sp. 2447]QIT55566.1 single-stranded-DNA-specific exonuclease RecJ [Aquisalimonas sp. 2447]